MSDKITVLVIRDPDEYTEVYTDGDVEIISVDLGSSFTKYLDPDDAANSVSWVLGYLRQLDGHSTTSVIYARLLEVMSNAASRYDLANWLVEYGYKLHTDGELVTGNTMLDEIERMDEPVLCEKHEDEDGVECHIVYDEARGDGYCGECPAHADASEPAND